MCSPFWNWEDSKIQVSALESREEGTIPTALANLSQCGVRPGKEPASMHHGKLGTMLLWQCKKGIPRTLWMRAFRCSFALIVTMLHNVIAVSAHFIHSSWGPHSEGEKPKKKKSTREATERENKTKVSSKSHPTTQMREKKYSWSFLGVLLQPLKNLPF